MTQCKNCTSLATHSFCNEHAESTDPHGNRVYEAFFVYCSRCADQLESVGEGEICSCCENFDSTMVSIDDQEFKPLYVPGTLDQHGMCQDHP